MLSKGKIKFIRSLKLRKYRQKYQKIVVEGAKTVLEMIAGGNVVVQEICATQEWIDAHEINLQNHSPAVSVVTSEQMQQISSFKTPQEVLAVCQMPWEKAISSAEAKDWILYLDAIRDPGNMGTILRVADWFGMRHVCISPDTVDPYHPRVIQASMGSIFRVSLHTTSLDEVRTITGSQVFTTAVEGRSVFGLTYSEPGILVLGNESQGVSSQARLIADDQISIPGDHRLGADSLNVAVAAGILCAAIRFGRGQQAP